MTQQPRVRVALVALVCVAIWLARGMLTSASAPAAPEPQRFEWILAGSKREIEMRVVPPSAPGQAPVYEYRFVAAEPLAAAWLDAASFQELLAAETRSSAGRHWLLKLLNASSWVNVLWVGVGLLGQLCFFARMFVQWLASEQEGASVVPPVFWWLSLWGGIALLSYFVWRQDPVGILGQATGTVVYLRNLHLIRRASRTAGAPRSEP